MTPEQQDAARYLAERNIPWDESFWWFLTFFPLPWQYDTERCKGVALIFDAEGKEVSVESVVKMVNEFDTSGSGCPMCGDIR